VDYSLGPLALSVDSAGTQPKETHPVEELKRCIAFNEVCADVCATTGAALSRRVPGDQQLVRTLLEACGQAGKDCGEECERHADMHKHCRVCAEACPTCEQGCRELLPA
jgi:hypothetical protein